MLSHSPNSAEKNSRAAIVSTTETVMVNLTSPAALSPLPRGPAKVYANAFMALFMSTIMSARCFASSDIAKNFKNSGVIANTAAFHTKDRIKVSLLSFLK